MKSLTKILTIVMLMCALTVLVSANAWAEGMYPSIIGTGSVVVSTTVPTYNSAVPTSSAWTVEEHHAISIASSNLASATINITENLNAAYSVQCVYTFDGGHTETVSGSISQTAASVSITSPDIGLSVSETYQLTAATNTGKPIEWSSNNPDAVSVSNTGLVTGKSEGSAVITASSCGGSDSRTIYVTVPTPISVTGVNLNYYDLELPVNHWAQLTATVVPSNADNTAVTWDSSDPSKVSVDANGVIRRIADGEVQITVTTADGGKTAVCSVSSPEPTPDLTLSENSIDLTNAARQLKVYCNDSDVTDACEWASYNPSVATVSKGIVTPVANGSTTISARYNVGSTDETLYCSVSVSKTTAPLTLSSYNLTLSFGGGNAFLQPYYNGAPIPASNCTWETSDPNRTVISVNQGTITPIRAGTASVRAIYRFNGTNVYSDWCTVTVGGTTFFTITAVSNNATFDGVNPLYFVTSAAYDKNAYPSVTIVGANNEYSRNLVYGSDFRVDCSPDGHMMITVNPVTLHNLPQSNFHNIAVSYGGQIAYARFWRAGTSYNVYGVRTGDDNNIALWSSLCLISFAGAAAIVITKRKDIFAK
ncbi:MAG: Ig-like domain-containing protein [Eubacteriales bacterium]|nr:Ig-like domain-containing protein [Eubacteriales bacterium]